MKWSIISIVCIFSNIVNAEWQTIGDYDVNTSTGEFWNQKAAIGGTLNNDLSIASLQTNATVQLIDELNNTNEIAIDQEPITLYNAASPRRTTRAELFEEVCKYFKVSLDGYECDNIRKISMATFGMMVVSLARGEQVKIAGFGNFGLRKQNARGGRNPKTGEPIEIPAIRRVTFHPSAILACTVDLDGGAPDRSICDGTTTDPEYMLRLVGSNLQKSEGEEGFTATTNTKDPPPIVRVTTTVDPDKGIISPSNDFYAGSKMTLNVLPKSGWRFAGWTNSQCASGYAPNTPITCEPTFIKLYNLIGTTSPPEGGTVTGTGQFAAGDKISLVFNTSQNYRFVNYTPTNCGYTSTMPASDFNCTRNVEKYRTLNANTLPLYAGTVTGGGQITVGKTVTLTQIPAAGSRFTGWSDPMCASSFAMPDNDLTCTANYVLQNKIMVVISPTGSGTVTNSNTYFDVGTTITLTPVPAATYKFSSWTGTGCSNTMTVVSPTKTCQANFVKI